MDKWNNSIHIQKQEGAGECGNYRPIFLKKIIYKVGPWPIARKLSKITHILARNFRFGYKEGVSTTDAIIKTERYVEHANRDAEILLMGRPKAFDTVNSTLIWTALYR